MSRIGIGDKVRVLGPTKNDSGRQFVGRVGCVKSRTRSALYVTFTDGKAANFARDQLERQ